MRGRTGSAYDEVIGAKVLLAYGTQHQQQQAAAGSSFPLISHPVAGMQVRTYRCTDA